MVRLKIWQNGSLFLRVIIIIINFSIRKAFSFIFSKIGDYIYFHAFQLIVSFIFLRHWINFLYSLMYSFFFLFVFFRNILFVYFFILFNFLSFFWIYSDINFYYTSDTCIDRVTFFAASLCFLLIPSTFF